MSKCRNFPVFFLSLHIAFCKPVVNFTDGFWCFKFRFISDLIFHESPSIMILKYLYRLTLSTSSLEIYRLSETPALLMIVNFIFLILSVRLDSSQIPTILTIIPCRSTISSLFSLKHSFDYSRGCQLLECRWSVSICDVLL